MLTVVADEKKRREYLNRAKVMQPFPGLDLCVD